MIIDSHVYCLPPRWRTPRASLPSAEAAVAAALHRHPDGGWVLPLSSPEAILRSMKSSGVDRSVLVALPWASPRLCAENNEFILDAAREPRFLAVCSVQPLRPGFLDEARSRLDAGAVGIKINPAWQGGSLDDPAVQRLAALVERRGRFLLVHTDHAFRRSTASAARLLELARRRPKTRIVAAHLGGMLGLYSSLPRLKPLFRNLWFDTAVSETMEMVRWHVEAGLARRLVFGTDYPFNGCHSQKKVVRRLKALRLGTKVEEGILHENIEKLLTAPGAGFSGRENPA